jgi:two-component system, NtrC family, sensor kinase
VLGEDVTSREETRERLLQSERLAAIGRLAAQITHEIRNPLSSVALNIELLGDDLVHLPVERQKEAGSILGAVGKEVDRLTQITEGYLRFAKLPAPRKIAGDVGDLLADIVAFTQADAAKAGVMLELHVEPDLPPVPHDPARLRQAVLNLLRNGVEAAGRGGTVRVGARVSPSGKGARVSVEDTGPGVPDDVKARLFQPFFTTKPQGTGLGLMLAREIVLEHKGELEVETSPLGGASFTIELPR